MSSKSKNKAKDKKKTKKKKALTARDADRYALYLKSVQAPDAEVPFFEQAYRDAYGGGKPMVLREDFCGTFAVCCEWVKSHRDRQAIGVDLDPEPLEWGRTHNLAKVPKGAQLRIKLRQDDVRTVNGQKADVLAAQNFSFWVFKTRDELREYLKAACRNLKAKGVMILDMMGGSEVIEENHEDVSKYRQYTYVWEQARFDPLTHECLFHIHFRFKDGTKLKKAFTYDWRLWTIPEVREVLLEVGFKRANVYWEKQDKKGNDTGEYARREHAPSDPAWVCYIVGVK